MSQTTEQLLRDYWGRIHDLCEAQGIDPRRCVKFDGEIWFNFERRQHPPFTPPWNYQLALTVLGGTPIFKGDEVEYTRVDGAIFHFRADENTNFETGTYSTRGKRKNKKDKLTVKTHGVTTATVSSDAPRGSTLLDISAYVSPEDAQEVTKRICRGQDLILKLVNKAD